MSLYNNSSPEKDKHFAELLKKAMVDTYNNESKGFYVGYVMLKKVGNVQYALYFMTRNLRGLDAFLTASEKATSLIQQQNPKAFDENFENNLHSFLCQKRTNNEIYEWSLRNGKSKKYMAEFLKSLLKDNYIKISKISEKSKKGCFYLNYNYYKKRDNRIFIVRNESWQRRGLL